MRRWVVVLALVLGLVPLTAATAQAIQVGNIVACNTDPCYGSDNGDNIWEQRGRGVDDEIWAKGGDDWVQAQTYTDDSDALFGGKGDDTIWANDGDNNDEIHAGLGHDTCYVDSQEYNLEGCEIIRGREGNVIRCHDSPCYGSGARELILEQRGDHVGDDIRALAGGDAVFANEYGFDHDEVDTGRGVDLINVMDGDDEDVVLPGRGTDKCFVDSRKEGHYCEHFYLPNGELCIAGGLVCQGDYSDLVRRWANPYLP